MKIDLGKILTRSWQIIWNHKVLWVFGILAGFASGRGGGNGGNSSSGDNPSFDGDFQFQGMEEYGVRAGELFQQYMLIIIGVCAFILLLSLLFFALGMMGRIGMLKGVYKVEQGILPLQFGELWSESMPYFWRFAGLNFLVGLAFFILIVPFIVIGVATAGIGFACLLPLICLLVPIGWAVNVIMVQAQAAIVAEDLSMFEGFKRGWEIAKSDIGGMIVLSIVLAIISAVIGVIISIPIILAVLPFVFSMFAYDGGASLPPTAWISLACCAVYFPILLGLNGVLTAYLKTGWALSYLQLTKPTESTSIPAQVNA